MDPEVHERAFRAIKKTIFDWSVKALDVEEAQRTTGHLASRGIAELLTAYLHRTGRLGAGGFVNHRWLRSLKLAATRLPAFPERDKIIPDLVQLELECDKLAYGKPVGLGKLQEVLRLFAEIERRIEQLEKRKG